MDGTDRREFLTALSAVGVAGVAGCPGDGGPGAATTGVSTGTTATDTTPTTDSTTKTTTEESTETTRAPTVSEWETTVSGDYGTVLLNWTAGVDGGYLLTGESNENAAARGDRHAVRVNVDDSGETVWSHVGGNDGWNWDFGALTIEDGYVVAGARTLNPDSDEYRYETVVREYDASGDQRWETRLGGADENTQVDGLLPGVDDGYLAYSRQDDDTGGRDAAMWKLDADGEAVWSRTFGTDDYDAFWRGLTVDDGYVFAGEYDETDGYLLKTDAAGSEQWRHTPTDDGNSRLTGITEADDGLLAVGSTGDDGWVVKIAADGTEEWTETYDNESESWFNDVNAHEDGYYLVGRTAGGTDDYSDAWVVEIDADGEHVDARTDGDDGDDALYSIEPTDDGGYLVVGWTTPDGAADSMGWVLKVADPIAGIEE